MGTPPKRQASASQQSVLKNYTQHHLQVLMATLGNLYRAPFSNLMSVLVIAIALSLPTLMLVGLENTRQLASGWDDNSARISLFLKSGIDNTQGEQLARTYAGWAEVFSSEYISPEQSLEEFKAYSGLSNVLDMLDENPLPGVVIVSPTNTTPEAVDELLKRLQMRSEVELAQLDLAWLERLYAIMNIGERGVMLLGVLLILAVLLIVGNTIRVGIQQRRDEIEVCKLVGGTNGFIQRPFLYLGVLQGFLGGVLALVVVAVAYLMLSGPAAQLAELYQSSFQLQGLALDKAFGLLGLSMVLGWLGAWLTVRYYIKQIEP
jgi:cell division transport system permease protein